MNQDPQRQKYLAKSLLHENYLLNPKSIFQLYKYNITVERITLFEKTEPNGREYERIYV